MPRHLPKPPAHSGLLRALAQIPAGFVSAATLVLAAVVMSAGLRLAPYVLLVTLLVAARRSPVWVRLALLATAGAEPAYLHAGQPSTDPRVTVAMTVIPFAVVLLPVRRLWLRRTSLRGSRDASRSPAT